MAGSAWLRGGGGGPVDKDPRLTCPRPTYLSTQERECSSPEIVDGKCQDPAGASVSMQ